MKIVFDFKPCGPDGIDRKISLEVNDRLITDFVLEKKEWEAFHFTHEMGFSYVPEGTKLVWEDPEEKGAA